MKSHKANAVLTIMIAVAALMLQVRAIGAESQHKAAGAKGKGAAAAVANGKTAAAVPPALSVTPANLSFDAEVGPAVPTAQSLAVSGGSGVVSYSVSTSSTGGWLQRKGGVG